DGGFDQAIAALAINEAYGLTSSATLREPAIQAVNALMRMQGPNGGWGGPGPTAWAIMACASAEINDLPLSEGWMKQALAYVDATPHEGNFWSRRLLHQRYGADDVMLVHTLTASPPNPSNLAAWHHAADSVKQYDGPGGPYWKHFSNALKQAVLSQQQSDGSWPADTRSNAVVRTSLAVLALQTLWTRYNVFGN